MTVESRLTTVEVQLVQLREEMRDESSALRIEIRTGDDETRRTVRAEIRAGDEETRRVLREEIRAGDQETQRVLREEIRAGDQKKPNVFSARRSVLGTKRHGATWASCIEEVIARIALMQEGRDGG